MMGRWAFASSAILVPDYRAQIENHESRDVDPPPARLKQCASFIALAMVPLQKSSCKALRPEGL